VDTNVLAYYAFQTSPFHEEVTVLFSKSFALIAPASWYSEFLNVAWLATRSNSVALEQGLALLGEIECLLDWSEPVHSLWREAFVMAQEYGVSTCDTLFVALAEREHCNLVSYDQKLLTIFPAIALRPDQVLTA
jgi:predicted nucleic acid-binding protein